MKMTITPELALELLEKNVNNRSVNKSHVKFLANEITNNRWSYTGDAIKISNSDILIDGQHRLLAVVASGLSVKMEVITGVDNDSFEKVDCGMKRSAGQVLSMSGIPYANNVAAIVRSVYLIDAQGGLTRDFTLASGIKIGNSVIRDKAIELIDFIQESGLIAKGAKIGAKTPVLSVLLWISIKYDSKKPMDFLTYLSDGLFSNKKDPAKKLHDKILSARGLTGGRNNIELMAFTVKAWNKWNANEEMSSLHFNQLSEKFPSVNSPK